jgi:branched-chain amino acid transport system ATP-binding protein
MKPLLSVTRLNKAFGGLLAVSDVSFDVNEHELLGLIGPNGAGKTTLFNVISGLYVPTSGTITLNSSGKIKVISGLAPYKITRLGMARTFQNIRLFKNMSVLDNIKVAMSEQVKTSLWTTLLRLPMFYKEEQRVKDQAISFLESVGLDHLADQKASSLPYGKQRQLEIARALATGATTLLLDEPAAGMNPQETEALAEFIKTIHTSRALTILLIEHDMNLIMKITQRIIVLDYGKVIANDIPANIKLNKRVIEAYLGEEQSEYAQD